MKNPQTLAVELNKVFPNEDLKNIADFACCAFVTMWCMGIEPDDGEAILTIQKAIKAKVIDKDCTVHWFDFIEWLTGRQLERIYFTDTHTLLGIKERTPVKFMYNGKPHWIGVEDGEIRFNSLKNSIIVAKGKPVTMRKLIMKKSA